MHAHAWLAHSIIKTDVALLSHYSKQAMRAKEMPGPRDGDEPQHFRGQAGRQEPAKRHPHRSGGDPGQVEHRAGDECQDEDRQRPPALDPALE